MSRDAEVLRSEIHSLDGGARDYDGHRRRRLGWILHELRQPDF